MKAPKFAPLKLKWSQVEWPEPPCKPMLSKLDGSAIGSSVAAGIVGVDDGGATGRVVNGGGWEDQDTKAPFRLHPQTWLPEIENYR